LREQATANNSQQAKILMDLPSCLSVYGMNGMEWNVTLMARLICFVEKSIKYCTMYQAMMI
jgi:hypothetical protein